MQNSINREENIDWNFESKLFEKWAVLSYLKKHKIDLTAYVFAAIVAGSVMLQSSPNKIEEFTSTIQQTVETQKNQVSNILNQSNWDIKISNQITSESNYNKQETQKEYIKSLELDIDFQYDSTIKNAGEADYYKETGKWFIRLNDQKIASISKIKDLNPDMYAEVLYQNELWSIKFMHKNNQENFQENYSTLSKKYNYFQVAEICWEFSSLKTLEEKGSSEANKMFLLRIKEIIDSSWSKNQYAMISDTFKSIFNLAFNDDQWEIAYTDEWINQLLNQNHFWELPHYKVSNFIMELENNLSSQWIYVDDILNQWNIWAQIAQNTDYTNY